MLDVHQVHKPTKRFSFPCYIYIYIHQTNVLVCKDNPTSQILTSNQLVISTQTSNTFKIWKCQQL